MLVLLSTLALSSLSLSLSLSAHVRKMESFRFGQSIRALVSDISRLDDYLECAEGYEYRLEVCLRELLAMESIGVLEQPYGPGSDVLRCISEAHAHGSCRRWIAAFLRGTFPPKCLRADCFI